jgi:hypothetical protein
MIRKTYGKPYVDHPGRGCGGADVKSFFLKKYFHL